MASLSHKVLNAGKDDEEKDEPKKPDGIAKVYEEHDDSVYGLTWGASSSSVWNFASLSYDGHIVVNYVPQEYSDLLLY